MKTIISASKLYRRQVAGSSSCQSVMGESNSIVRKESVIWRASDDDAP
jgi:hypothetical protein